MRRALAILALLSACTVETDDAPSSTGTAPQSGPYQWSCVELAECIESDRPLCSLDDQGELDNASDAIDQCDYERDSGQAAFDSCIEWACG